MTMGGMHDSGGGMHDTGGGGACMTGGVHGGGMHAWWRGHAWHGGMCDSGYSWQGGMQDSGRGHT